MESAWLSSTGRSPASSCYFAGGYRGDGVTAGVIAVTEAPPGHGIDAERAISALREAFAEGVAYGAEGLLGDFSRKPVVPDGTSMAAAAFSRNEVWINSNGSCRVFLYGTRFSSPKGRMMSMPAGYSGHLYMEPGDIVVLAGGETMGCLESGVGRLPGRRGSRSLAEMLSGIIKDSGAGHGKSGGSIAAVRFPGRRKTLLRRVPAKITVAVSVVVMISLLAVLLLCGSDGVDGAALRSYDADTTGNVMPLK